MNKKEYKVLNPIAHGGRVERGEVILLTDEEAAQFGPNLIVLVGAETPVVVVEKPLEEMNLTELRKKAKEMELNTSGSKADLLEKIKLALA